MNSFKSHLLAMASAIALMTGAAPAFAYSNKAYIDQSGSYTTAYQSDQSAIDRGNGNLAAKYGSTRRLSDRQLQARSSLRRRMR
jgi:hypothetical protein